MITRLVEPELLDSLPADDPRAVASRRDLRVINAWMGNAGHLSAAIRKLGFPPRRVLEIGTGDGTLMLKLSRAIPAGAELWLLDLEPVVSGKTVAALRDRGYSVGIARSRIEDWVEGVKKRDFDLIIANLVLHHFSDQEIKRVFVQFSKLTRSFISCDPRRWTPALWATRALWLLGCNDVTRHDAVISVRAGFRDSELSQLWPTESGFRLTERPAGFSSHLFSASHQPSSPG